MAKPARLRQLAADDVEAAIDRYIDDAGPDVAGRFIDAVERGLQQISRNPHNGSLRFAYELDLPELRVWPLARFPHLVFHLEREHEIDSGAFCTPAVTSPRPSPMTARNDPDQARG